MIAEPSILLLDDCLCPLSPAERLEVGELVWRAQRTFGQTILHATRDITEALQFADRAALLLNGGVVQIGAPQDLFYRPQTLEAARFVGCENLIPARVEGTIARCGSLILRIQSNRSGEAHLVIRAQNVRLSTDSDAPDVTRISGRLKATKDCGLHTEAQVDAGILLALRPSPAEAARLPGVGAPICVSIAPQHIHPIW